GWGGGGNGPVGLVIFADPDYRGYSLQVRGSIDSLYGSGLDDEITSVRVISGRWELCNNANFGGQCVVVDRDTPNLKTVNMNDRVSSIRRLR
ncbi:hypothetical protein GVN21_10780, partial [Caulobacter sp. SLTY]|uniref:beta/gamma crystallin-related protein n=1 Tax=Caulobacter sp. SLTY TaxID=2683262 RepID=UPI00141242C4